MVQPFCTWNVMIQHSKSFTQAQKVFDGVRGRLRTQRAPSGRKTAIRTVQPFAAGWRWNDGSYLRRESRTLLVRRH